MKVLIKPNATDIQSYEAVAITEDIYRVNNKYYKKSSLIFLEDGENEIVPKIIPEIIPDMVFIKGGYIEFEKNIPSQKGEISDFYIGKYPVTQKQWTDVMGTNPSYFKGCDNCPVESVSWNDVQDFIKKLNAKTGKNYRLPTSLEWFYAAIGGKNYEFERYDNYVPKTEYLDGATEPVGQKKPNGYGLHDMTNNVWEWCDDWSDYYNGRHAESKVLCGHKRIENYASLKITESSNASGFRLAL